MCTDHIGLDFVGVGRESVTSEELDGEVVLYDELSESIHHLNLSASEVWFRLDGSVTLGELIDDLTAALGVHSGDVAADVLELVRQLNQLSLLQVAGKGHRPP